MSTKLPSPFDLQILRKPNYWPQAQVYQDVMHDGHWTRRKISFESDYHDFHVRMSQQQQESTVRGVSLISQVEIAPKSFWGKLGDTLQHPCFRDLGYVMANVEVIHNDAYEFLLTRLGMNDQYEKILALPQIAGRVNYLRKYSERKYDYDEKKQFLYSIILFTLFVENVALFSQFYMFNWFGREMKMLKGLNDQVKYTRNEEDIHAQVGIWLIKDVILKAHPELWDDELKDRIRREAQEAVEYDISINNWMVNGIKHETLSGFILNEFHKDRMNQSLIQIGIDPVFDINQDALSCTDWFYEELKGIVKTDTFHAHSTEYATANQSFAVEELFLN